MYVEYIENHPSGLKKGSIRKVKEKQGKQLMKATFSEDPKTKKKTELTPVYVKESTEDKYKEHVDGFHSNLKAKGKQRLSDRLKSQSENFEAKKKAVEARGKAKSKAKSKSVTAGSATISK